MFPVHYQLSNCSQAGYPTALTILTLLLAKIWFLCFSWNLRIMDHHGSSWIIMESFRPSLTSIQFYFLGTSAGSVSMSNWFHEALHLALDETHQTPRGLGAVVTIRRHGFTGHQHRLDSQKQDIFSWHLQLEKRRAEKPGVVLKTYCTELMIVNANANAMILLVWWLFDPSKSCYMQYICIYVYIIIYIICYHCTITFLQWDE